MKFTFLESMLWAAGFMGHVSLLTVLLVKKRFIYFPVFTSFAAYAAIETITLFFVSRSGNHQAYSRTYWTFAFVDYAFQVAILIEIAKNVLRPTGTWFKDARRSFILWSFAGAVIAAILAVIVTPPGRAGLDLWTIRSMLFTALLTCEIFLAMAAAANRLSLQWRSHVMALGQGLTAWAVITLASDIIRLALGWSNRLRVFDTVNSAVYLCSLIFWIVSFSLPERVRKPLPPHMREYLIALHKRVTYDLGILNSAEKSR